MIDLKTVENIHNILIDKFGGGKGIRDKGALEAAIVILIEEIEIGLHPKIQRRVMDILYHESIVNKKQFIISLEQSTPKFTSE